MVSASLAGLIEARFGLESTAGKTLAADGALAAMLVRRVCRGTPFITLLNPCVFFGKWSESANPTGASR